MQPQIEYACEVKEVFSGDDLIAWVDLGTENLWKKQRLRLSGVDTPNAIGAQGDTEAGQIRTFVRQLTRGKKSKITIVSRTANSWVVTLIVETHEGPVNVNELLIGRGYEFKQRNKVADEVQ